jgi:hypothetical protein
VITYLPDGREVTVTQRPGPVVKAVFASDPDGVSGYGASGGEAVEGLLAAEAAAEEEALYRAFIQARARAARAVLGGCTARQAVHHADGDPWNNDPGNLVLVDVRENFRAGNINDERLDNQSQYLPEPGQP